ncbi:MAG: ABC transporter ATP-binding protein [Planctomycetaceae bacterium]|nr:ABC transporter ATP-binding protein [Planctomycetaceae bacterium]
MTQDESSTPAVELVGVRKEFGERTILDGIDLEIARGEVLVLVGPSGSGKSTLLKIVSGIETPDAGEVWLSGECCTNTPPYRRPVHTVFQNYALFPHLDVAGNVAFPLAVAGMPASRRQPLVEQALGWVHMQRHARRRIDALSGGEKQRVALARALVDRPQCVLLDEPLSALDPHLRAGTLELLEELQAELGLTYLFITHDREEALRIGHRIGVLNHGRLEQIGPPEEVYRRPKTAFVASFLGKINWLSGVKTASGRELEICGCHIPIASQSAAAPGLPPGPVKVGLRPEDVRIGPSGRIQARVVSRLFFGDSTTIRVQAAGDCELVVDQRPASDAAVGDTVWLDWSADAMHLFAGDEPEGPASDIAVGASPAEAGVKEQVP